MTDETGSPHAAFAAFRSTVFADLHLLTCLRVPRERETFAALVVCLGAARGFVFDEATVVAAMREGEDRWLMLGADVV